MNHKSPKVQYAQSSDVQSRTFAQYRHDMKVKGIRELEFKEYLQRVLQERHKDPDIRVAKHGEDAELWFQRAGAAISHAPDYAATLSNEANPRFFEFQLANAENLKTFDFKVSKVGRKTKTGRIPHEDREIFYVVSTENKYTLLAPSWILQNGREGQISAWRSLGIKVDRKTFLAQCKDGGSDLKHVLELIEGKIQLLEFQKRFLESETRKLSSRLQKVVDDKEVFKIVPRTLQGIYEVCYFMEKMNEQPSSPSVWLVYLASFLLSDHMSSTEFARFMFAFDFIYFKCGELKDNEKRTVQQVIQSATAYIQNKSLRETGLFKVAPNLSRVEGLSHYIFTTNLLEDIQQDAVVNFAIELPPITKIFETVPNLANTVAEIKEIMDHE